MISKSYVLAAAEDRSALIDAVNDVCLQLNWIEGTTFGYAGSEDDDGVQYDYWLQASGAIGRIRLVNDQEMPAQYVEVAVQTEHLHEQIYMLLGRSLTVANDSGLKDAARQAANADPGALMRLGVGHRGGFDPEIHALIKAGLNSQDVAVRRAAAMAVLLLKWPQFAPALNTAIALETDETLRAQLEFVAGFIQH